MSVVYHLPRDGSACTDEPPCVTGGARCIDVRLASISAIEHGTHDWREWGGASHLARCQRCGIIRTGEPQTTEEGTR